MHFNASKTKAMLIFPTVQYDLYRPLRASGSDIQFVHTFNYLGVIIEESNIKYLYCQKYGSM